MTTLRSIRQKRSAFDPTFFERSALFAPIARGAAAFRETADWAPPEDYARAFDAEPPIRFEPSSPQRRRGRGTPIERDRMYDARITRERVVPTRPRCWHDFLNALVWAAFPRAKTALHARQHRAIEAWIPPDATRLPNARTRELDALALIDEGGVLVLEGGTTTSQLVFGHALYEGLVLEQRAMIARAVVLPVTVVPEALEDAIALADASLAARLDDRTHVLRPEELPCLPLSALA